MNIIHENITIKYMIKARSVTVSGQVCRDAGRGLNSPDRVKETWRDSEGCSLADLSSSSHQGALT